MDLSNTPSKVQIPFANATTYKYTIPVPSQVSTDVRKASYEDGFPPLTMEPISSGGVAPYGQDFNGLLNQLSAGLRWGQTNTPFKFDSEFCASIGGYPLGARLLSADNTHYWISQAANNTTNPDTVGANWIAGESIVTGYYPKSTTADKWTTARTFSFTGDTTGTGSVDGSGDVPFAMTVVQAAKWKTERTFSFSGDITGSASVDGSSNITLPVTITPRTTVAFSGSSISVSLTLASYTGGTLSSSVYKVTMVDGTSYAVGDMCYSLFTNVTSGTMYVDYGDSTDFIFEWSYSAGVLTLSTPSRGSFGRVDIYY